MLFRSEFLIIHDWKRPWRITGNSSVYRFRLGAHPDVLERFRQTQEVVRARLRNEQADVAAALRALENWAATQNARWLGLQVVATNAPAIALYERLGYVSHATNRFWVKS